MEEKVRKDEENEENGGKWVTLVGDVANLVVALVVERSKREKKS